MTQETMYQQLSEAVGVGDSKIIPEIFKMLVDENEAKVLALYNKYMDAIKPFIK